MNRMDFLTKYADYISTLEQAEEPMTKADWSEWIQKECIWHDETLTTEQISWIIEELEKEGLIDNTYEVAVALMDDEIREELHREMAPCTNKEFLQAYKKRHFEKYGEEFTI